jgi:hypothetical protein
LVSKPHSKLNKEVIYGFGDKELKELKKIFGFPEKDDEYIDFCFKT